MHPTTYRPRGMPSRHWFALAAAVISLGSFAVLLAGFDGASPRQWLAPTPYVMELVAHCDAMPQRVDRDHCTRRVVTALRERQQREPMLASR